MRLWLQGAVGADRQNLGDICYEFVSQSLLLFEESVSDSHEQYEAIRALAGCLQQVGNAETSLDEENYDTLRSKCVSHSNRLLKKPAAAQCFILCANLYVDTKYVEGRVAAKCLMKACKRASQMMNASDMIGVFLAVLNKYIYLCLKHVEFEQAKMTQLIELISDKIKEQQMALQDGGSGDGDAQHDADVAKLAECKQFFRLSVQYIKDLQNSNDEQIAQTFAKIDL